MIKDIMTFYKDKKVLVTGHTGFKGSWMVAVLLMAGAKITGYALKPPTDPSLFELLGLNGEDNVPVRPFENCPGELVNIYADIRNLDKLKETFAEAKPEIVIHMAAQPLVRSSYKDPVYTYETNIMGTVNVLECCRLTDSVKSIINVTTDKVYLNTERDEGYREEEKLCGYDPYANSKSCSELVTYSYRNSFFKEKGIPVTTMRAGNVIGGGDFARDRIIPDCVRAAIEGKDIIVRNPYSIRPYQHVLEPVVCYLGVAAGQYMDPSVEGCYNVGPDDKDALSTAKIATMFCDNWNSFALKTAAGAESNKNTSEKIAWINKSDGGPHEDKYLKLDCTRIKERLGWHPLWDADRTMRELVKWYKAYSIDSDLKSVTKQQVEDYLECLSSWTDFDTNSNI